MRNAPRLEATSLMPPVAYMRPVFPQVHFLPIRLFDKCKHSAGYLQKSNHGKKFACKRQGKKNAPAARIVCEAGVRHPPEPLSGKQEGESVSTMNRKQKRLWDY